MLILTRKANGKESFKVFVDGTQAVEVFINRANQGRVTLALDFSGDNVTVLRNDAKTTDAKPTENSTDGLRPAMEPLRAKMARQQAPKNRSARHTGDDDSGGGDITPGRKT